MTMAGGYLSKVSFFRGGILKHAELKQHKLCVGKKNHLCERVTNIQLKDNAALREYAYE